jgi:threonine dehydratase
MKMAEHGVTTAEIRAARERIAGLAVRTPLVPSPLLGEKTGGSIYLKLENVQPTGSFKIRGAASRMRRLDAAQRARGVITVSSGNHGRAVSYVGRSLGVRAVVCLARTAPPHKLEAIRRLGGETVIAGDDYDAAAERAAVLETERGLVFVEPFDDPDVIAGQGTAGLEILEDLPDVDAVLVPVGGGGLASGIALAVKAARPRARVVGVSMERGPGMYRSLRAGSIVKVVEEPTLADAIAGGIGAVNRHTLELCRDLLDDFVLVSEEEIAAAMAFLLREHRLVVEGGGAVGVASLLAGRAPAGGRTVVVLSGGNVDVERLCEIARGPG